MVVPPPAPNSAPPLVIVATDELLQLHTPPGVEQVSPIALPTHMSVIPGTIGVEIRGFDKTVSVAVCVQEPTVYEMTTVPVAIPNTLPEPFTVARDVLLLLHVPPDKLLPRVISEPIHTVVGPARGWDTLTVAVPGVLLQTEHKETV